ncbi:MAG TPA: hypothetical protein VNR20_03265 [Terriglobales bacterium]|nr:hypothetical protein [Terriglobales bacterium]
MRKTIAGFVVGLIVATAVNAFAQNRGRWIYGVGNTSCGGWVENRRQVVALKGGTSTLNDKDLTMYIVQASWVLGFISGAGWDSVSAVTTRETDMNGIFVAVDKACAEDPTHDISDAAMKVFVDLVAK